MGMTYFAETEKLTHAGVLAMLSAAVERAEAIVQPQCIVVVDSRCTVLGEIHMTGSKVLSRDTATVKAVTAASHNMPSASIPEAARPAVAAATGGAGDRIAGRFANPAARYFTWRHWSWFGRAVSRP